MLRIRVDELDVGELGDTGLVMDVDVKDVAVEGRRGSVLLGVLGTFALAERETGLSMIRDRLYAGGGDRTAWGRQLPVVTSSFFFEIGGDRGDLTGEVGGDGRARRVEEDADGMYAGGDVGDNDDRIGSDEFESSSKAFGGDRSTTMTGLEEDADVGEFTGGIRGKGSGFRFRERKYLTRGIQPLREFCDLVHESVKLLNSIVDVYRRALYDEQHFDVVVT
jgi:hypothetical protein